MPYSYKNQLSNLELGRRSDLTAKSRARPPHPRPGRRYAAKPLSPEKVEEWYATVTRIRFGLRRKT